MFKRFTSICLLLAVLLSLVVLPAKAFEQPKETNVALGKTVTFTSGGECRYGCPHRRHQPQCQLVGQQR